MILEFFSNDWDTHCVLLTCILNVLEVNNFTVNPHKCEWAVQDIDWLGYWLTPPGLKPWKKKIAAILAMQHLQTVTQFTIILSQRQRQAYVDSCMPAGI
jgi:hypothetical protein